MSQEGHMGCNQNNAHVVVLCTSKCKTAAHSLCELSHLNEYMESTRSLNRTTPNTDEKMGVGVRSSLEMLVAMLLA